MPGVRSRRSRGGDGARLPDVRGVLDVLHEREVQARPGVDAVLREVQAEDLLAARAAHAQVRDEPARRQVALGGSDPSRADSGSLTRPISEQGARAAPSRRLLRPLKGGLTTVTLLCTV